MGWKGESTVIQVSKHQLRISIPAIIVTDEAFSKSGIKEGTKVDIVYDAETRSLKIKAKGKKK